MNFVIGLISIILLSGVAVFQILLATGLPQGDMVMGGRFPAKLPMNMRIVSLATALVLMGMVYVFAVKSGIISSDLITGQVLNVLMVVISVFLGVNTIGNLASQSKKERMIMTPITLMTAICGVLLLIS